MLVKDLQILAARVILPKRLSTCQRPVCSACCFGNASKKPWRAKGKEKGAILYKLKKKTGEIAHEDIMTSSFPGLIPQMTGYLTAEKYHYTSFFIDDVSDYSFACHQKSTSVADTLEAKASHEQELHKHGKEVRHYHADNRTHACAGCRYAILKSNQSITYYGAGTYFQNGKAENRIKTTSNPARTMLLHAMHRWPRVITPALWPFVISMAVDVRNKHKHDKYGIKLEERLSGTKFKMEIQNQHVFGYPCYILEENLQDRQKIPQWNECTRVGVYLGRSRLHTSSVALALNLNTGYISPQCHVVFDDAFETIESLEKGIVPKRWDWLATHCRECIIDE